MIRPEHACTVLIPLPGQSIRTPVVVMRNRGEQGDGERVEAKLFWDIVDNPGSGSCGRTRSVEGSTFVVKGETDRLHAINLKQHFPQFIVRFFRTTTDHDCQFQLRTAPPALLLCLLFECPEEMLRATPSHYRLAGVRKVGSAILRGGETGTLHGPV